MREKTTKRTIRVETTDGPRWMRVPEDVLRDSQCTYANQVDTGVYCTDEWTSPHGRVIQRMYSCWDTGRGCCQGTYYQLAPSDPADEHETIDA